MQISRSHDEGLGPPKLDPSEFTMKTSAAIKASLLTGVSNENSVATPLESGVVTATGMIK